MSGVFWYVFPHLGRSGASAVDPNGADRARADLEAGRQSLGEGRFEKALKQLNAAAALCDANPGLLPAVELHQLASLQRQTNLLSRLLSRPLQDIVREAGLVRDEEEWKERFTRDYRGKSVIFDDAIKRDAAGRPAFGVYAANVGDEPVRVALEDLEVLQSLPLNVPRRILFGGQIAAIEREGGGSWVVHFVPASGVLITDVAAATACYPEKLDDELLGLLQRQAEWGR